MGALQPPWSVALIKYIEGLVALQSSPLTSEHGIIWSKKKMVIQLHKFTLPTPSHTSYQDND
jgi:hypothetical protein